MALHYFSRRTLLGIALSAGVVGTRSRSAAQTQSNSRGAATEPPVVLPRRSTVSLIHGETRRKNVTDALTAIDEQILPVLKTKKYKKFLNMLQEAMNPGLKFTVDKLVSNYRVGRNEIVLDRKWLAELKKKTHHQGLLSAVIELLPVVSDALSGNQWDERYRVTIQLITNVNKYAQQETAPKSIVKRKKPKKETV